MARIRLTALALAALFGGLAPAARADGPAIARGEVIAAGRCGQCHGTGRHDRSSPHPLVLPFAQFAERYPIEMLTDALATGTIEGHDEMPMFVLGPDDIRALVAYIDSLSPAGARYLAAGDR
jgi:mono/diheme cytochrome c family protein